MTLDEAIKHAEEIAEEQEKMAKEWHENQVRKCELIPFAEMDYTHENECKKCANEHIQLANWLKELKQLREQESKDELKYLSKRVEALEKQMKKDKEEQLEKLKAEREYARFCCALPTIQRIMGSEE